MWHAERLSPDMVALRFVRPPGHPSKRSPPDAVAMARLNPDTTAFLFLAKAHPPLSLVEWRSLGDLLRRDFDVTRINADRADRAAVFRVR